MKINIFWGDWTDISAKRDALVLSLHQLHEFVIGYKRSSKASFHIAANYVDEVIPQQ